MKENAFSPGARLAILAVLFVLFIVFPATFMIQSMLDEMLQFIVEHHVEEPGFKIASVLLPAYY